jgi:hypothetical protein
MESFQDRDRTSGFKRAPRAPQHRFCRRLSSIERYAELLCRATNRELACRASPGRRAPRAAARGDKPGCSRFQTFPIIGDADNFGFGPQPMGDTLTLWTAFFLPDREGSLLNNLFISPVFGHHALQYMSRGHSRARDIRTVTYDYNQ